jgi:CHAD domain-containing protein/CYTH domain-containing protein
MSWDTFPPPRIARREFADSLHRNISGALVKPVLGCYDGGPRREESSMRLGLRLLERSPQETTRHLCLRLLSEAEAALSRFERSDDGESLHDFRVALRRLRSVQRAYRPYLKGGIGKKRRARLRELASSTNQARDLDVQMAWLAEEAAGLDPEARAGAEELRGRLASRNGLRPDREALRRDFDTLRGSLEKSLSTLRARLEDLDTSFLAVTGPALSEAAEALHESLSAVHGVEDAAGLHRTRLAAKRLRYLLEPLAELEGVRRLLRRMKALQDVLGNLQDTHVLAGTISEELDRAALEDAHRLRDLTLRDGVQPEPLATQSHLLALLRAQRERRVRCYGELEREWLARASEPFFQDVARLAARLASSDGSGLSRRRFLLRSVPEEAKKNAPQIIREGFLPGRRIRESVRSEEAGRRTCYRRTVEAGGMISIEEPIDLSAFEELWALTEGRRSERVRYEVRAGDEVWLIDSISGRDVVLAEIDAQEDLVLPGWLSPLVLREVTGRRKYSSLSLVGDLRRPSRSAPGTTAGPRAEAP